MLTKPQHFHEFFTQFFLTNFLVKSKLSTAKKSKTTTFSRFFHPKKIDNFLGKSKWTKNEDFEQCGKLVKKSHFDNKKISSNWMTDLHMCKNLAFNFFFYFSGDGKRPEKYLARNSETNPTKSPQIHHNSRTICSVRQRTWVTRIK